ncbi:hypothetical protein BASA62_001926 [Batrachochytrium salamandrivorans]|nr:hypothetical protein BASA62_001926 [Batrachochytrium salamandrivorans]
MKAYAKAGKEIGMITTLQKMNMANIKMNADVLAIAAICLAMLPHNRTLHNLISGYVANGDAESVKLLIHHLHPSRNYSPTASLDHVIWAYYFAGDAIKALAHAKELDSQHTLIDYDVWYATLVCVVKFNPADIDGVVSHIRLKYPKCGYRGRIMPSKRSWQPYLIHRR